jgi:excisionase family DNA binding protein
MPNQAQITIDDADRLVTYDEAAKIRRVSRSTIFRLIKTGKLKTVKRSDRLRGLTLREAMRPVV